jgi:hypothetical protein
MQAPQSNKLEREHIDQTIKLKRGRDYGLTFFAS